MTTCADAGGRGDCVGPPLPRPALDTLGRCVPRCARHWADLCATYRTIRRTHPDLDVPPADLDPGYGGDHLPARYRVHGYASRV